MNGVPRSKCDCECHTSDGTMMHCTPCCYDDSYFSQAEIDAYDPEEHKREFEKRFGLRRRKHESINSQ